MKIYKRGNKKNNIYSLKEAKLPSNYLELFFDSIRQNWRSILGVGLLSLLFFIPSIAFMVMNDLYFMSLISNNIPLEEIDALRITANNFFNIGLCLFFLFASIGVSGLSRINLLLSREEGLFFFQDFNKGVKQNLKNNFVFFLVYALLTYFSLLVINNLNKENFLVYIPFAIVQTIFFPMLLINVSTTSIYSWSIKDSFRNSLIIYIKNFFVVVLYSGVLTSILLLNIIQYNVLKYILIALIIIFVYPFISLAFRVYMNKVLDRDINKEHYPEIYKKGIYEIDNTDYIENVVSKYYGETSTLNSIKNDPYLNDYYYHMCGFLVDKVNPKNTKIISNNGVWPDEAVIDSLNYLRKLAFDNDLNFLNKKDYSVLHLKQKERAKVAIVMAGGGYGEVCTLPEDIPVSVELHKKGMSVFSFVYPTKKDAINANNRLKEFINFLFKNQEKMNIDMEDYMLVGFSASGHLVASACLSNLGLEKEYRPLLLGLAYPVITMREDTHIGTRDNLLGENPSEELRNDYSIELHMDEYFPNTFIWACDKDNVVPFQNSLILVDKLKQLNIDYRFESFDDDKHGYGVAKNKVAHGWVDRMYDYYLLSINNRKV